MSQRRVRCLILLLCLGLTACGGGGGSGGSNSAPPPTTNPPPTPPPVNTDPTTAQLRRAAQFLDRASFGPTFAEIEALARSDESQWLDAQFEMAPSLHLPIVDRYIDEYGLNPNSEPFPGLFRRFAFWEQALTAPDQLRQLVAYALTQIFVVSDNVDQIVIDPRALSSYYDMLLNNSFGNFRDLLYDVTLHPAMGFYLSHVNNGKSDPVANTFPDENYAREVMQLFSIGLFELESDGSQRLDEQGNPIATYDNADIREFSRVFTGLSYGPETPGGTSFFGNQVPVMFVPMQMFDAFHEPGAKTLLGGEIIVADQSGLQDIEDAIDNLFNHPNVGPFIGKQLIQRLVTSNPSPAYVERISQVFADDGSGQRGNMQAIVRAILTDPQARSGERLREPFRRYVALNRSLQASGTDGTYPGLGFVAEFLTQQNVLSAPSVFNFYLPSFSPAGPIKDAGLVAPEFQIVNASTIVGATNVTAYALFSEASLDTPEGFTTIRPDLSELTDVVDDAEALIERITLMFFGGYIDPESRDILVDYAGELFAGTGDPMLTVQATLYVALSSPAYVVAGEPR